MEKKSSKKVVALIPLRGGSKSIPYKNIKPLNGKPLAYWVCKAALDSKHIQEVWVSTDDEKIKKAILKMNLGIKVIDRPAEFATDKASTESVMTHFAENVPFDVLVTIQATSPLTKSEHLNEAIEKLHAEKLDSLVTGVTVKRFFWGHDGKPHNYDPKNRPMRQDWKGVVMENGAFYITRKKILDEHKCRLGGKIGVYIMPDHTALEIDEPDDWKKITKLIKKRNGIA
jgi:N-acylneuraminate cytidylyltransferase